MESRDGGQGGFALELGVPGSEGGPGEGGGTEADQEEHWQLVHVAALREDFVCSVHVESVAFIPQVVGGKWMIYKCYRGEDSVSINVGEFTTLDGQTEILVG